MKRENNYIPEWKIDLNDLTATFEDIQTFIDDSIHIDVKVIGSCNIEHSYGTYDTPSSIDLINKEYDVKVLGIYDYNEGMNFNEIMTSNYYDKIVDKYQQEVIKWYKEVM